MRRFERCVFVLFKRRRRSASGRSAFGWFFLQVPVFYLDAMYVAVCARRARIFLLRATAALSGHTSVRA